MGPRAKKVRAKETKPNEDLANILLEIGEYEKNVNLQPFKYNAYRRASQSLLECDKKIKRIEDAKILKGVGKRIGERIEEYLKTGKIDKLNEARKNNKSKILKELNRVAGIGPSHAQKLFSEGIRSLKDLKSHQDLLTHHQKIGLKYVDDFEQRIPRQEMAEIEKFLVDQIKNIDVKYTVTICGSYRRGLESSGDVDVLITHSNYVSLRYAQEQNLRTAKNLIIETKKSPEMLLKKIIDKLKKLDFITDTIAFGDSKFMGVCKVTNDYLHRRIDIRILPFDEYFCGILHMTGSDMFNQNMRKTAKERGFILNEYCLRKLDSSGRPGKALKIESEEDIFKYLEINFKRPEERY
ncbi:DNA polymerase beta [Brachionus plicatilis]|uniref:DNA polymerase n=1 Tax=Brachionus plicatilis TaxID=10195 RepID=A0A3M7QZF1_BRAPC|nr:DNA polymerase beta [Brachionus plicatilis]